MEFITIHFSYTIFRICQKRIIIKTYTRGLLPKLEMSSSIAYSRGTFMANSIKSAKIKSRANKTTPFLLKATSSLLVKLDPPNPR
jgi:hypothetical protein